MSWIAIDGTVYEHRKTRRLKTRLKVDVYKLVGHLTKLWQWGLNSTGRDGVLHDVAAEDIAFGAGWREQDAERFAAALVDVGFLHLDGGVYSFHDWQEYTRRFYDGREASAANASASGAFGNHKRWHLNKGVFAEDCEHCQAERDPDQRSMNPQLPLGPTLVPAVPDVGANRGDVGATSLSDGRGEVASESLPTLPTSPDRSTGSISPSQPEPKLAQIARLKRELSLTTADWQEIRRYFPDADTNGRWIQWVEWIAKKESERKPKPEEAVSWFYGWLKKDDGSDRDSAAGQVAAAPGRRRR